MIIIRCPYCQEQRTAEELTYGGEADIARPTDPATVSDQQWPSAFSCARTPEALSPNSGVARLVSSQAPLPVMPTASQLGSSAGARPNGPSSESQSSNWASIALAGPRARDLLAQLAPNVDISNDTFAHMQIREGVLAGTRSTASIPTRILRVSITGELQYEISVHARYAASLLERRLQTHGDLSPKPVGLEARLYDPDNR
jgi:hypothetical protein